MRAFLIAVLLIVVAFIVWESPIGDRWRGVPARADTTVGTSGTLDRDKARAAGAELGEKAAIAGEKIKDATHDAAVTTKIKAKMALDETVKARSIDVSTDGSTVTVSGMVESRAEHDRAIALARETAGVMTVVDHLDSRAS